MSILDRNFSEIIDFLLQRQEAPFQFYHFGLLFKQHPHGHEETKQGTKKHGQEDHRGQRQLKIEEIQINRHFVGIKDRENDAENYCQD